ncbi:MAG: superoxide dismutase family protein [Chloroflexota bacterium]|nr:superoxide dismutase family protein [Chloroflexota bacterium]
MSLIARIGCAAVLILAAAWAAACAERGVPADAVGDRAEATLMTADGQPTGTVTLTQGPNGVLIAAEVRGLAPGPHGFHIHGVGACTPDFSAAGGHYQPGGEGHGFLEDDGHHAGDLPNIHAGADGIARADVFTDAVTLDSGAAHSLFDDDGSAFIVHAKPDSYGADPAAGDRVACGVIERR